jgi:hypothetical protein
MYTVQTKLVMLTHIRSGEKSCRLQQGKQQQ